MDIVATIRGNKKDDFNGPDVILEIRPHWNRINLVQLTVDGGIVFVNSDELVRAIQACKKKHKFS